MRPNDTVPPSSDELLFWIAINGPSCAIASHPATETLKVQPVPEVLLWFNTYEEAVENRHFILTAPSKEMHKRRSDLRRRAALGQVVVIRPENPEPPIRGRETHWMAGGSDDPVSEPRGNMTDEIKFMEITPELAAKWLENNPSNRGSSHTRWSRMRKR